MIVYEFMQSVLKGLFSWKIYAVSCQFISNNISFLYEMMKEPTSIFTGNLTKEFLHNSRLIRRIQQNKIYKQLRDLTKDWTQIACLAVSHSIRPECFLCLTKMCYQGILWTLYSKYNRTQWWIYIVKFWTRRRVQILSITCSFGKIWQNRMLAPPGGLVPPSQGNPGSATGTLSF